MIALKDDSFNKYLDRIILCVQKLFVICLSALLNYRIFLMIWEMEQFKLNFWITWGRI